MKIEKSFIQVMNRRFIWNKVWKQNQWSGTFVVWYEVWTDFINKDKKKLTWIIKFLTEELFPRKCLIDVQWLKALLYILIIV